MSGNPFERLRLPGSPLSGEIEGWRHEIAYSDGRELVDVITAPFRTEWVFGYSIFYANGRQVQAAPSPEHGRFATERDAKSYALGLISVKAPLSPEALREIARQIRELSQGSLFG